MTIPDFSNYNDALIVNVDWRSVVRTSRTQLTTHLWNAPLVRPGSPIHDQVFAALRNLKADHARFLPFWTHPRLSVPQLERPTEQRTHWNFELLDPGVDDFMAAAEGRPVVANFATIPAWMFATDEPVPYSDDPDEANWAYEQGRDLHDPSTAEVADYFERIASWYIAGGFTDELGVRHESGHDYRFAYWEVLCEPDVGHELSPEVYTRLYDEVVKRLRRLDPEMKFIGLSLAMVDLDPEYLWHFLDPDNHADGAAPDAFSYHFYACPDVIDPMDSKENPPYEEWRGAIFSQVEAFLDKVKLIESIKQRLSPHTKTFINEIGTFAPDVMNPEPEIPDEYWAIGSAMIGYLWSRLTELGIDLVGVAEFVGYPGVIPGVSLLDWETGQPNARYWVTKLLLDNFGPGDSLVSTESSALAPDSVLHARGFVTEAGQRKLLLVNKFPRELTIELGSGETGIMSYVDTSTGSEPPTSIRFETTVRLGPYATAVLTMEG